MVLADLPTTLEAMALEHGHGGVVEERARDLPPDRVFRVALNQAAAELCDLVERPGKGGFCHPLVSVRYAFWCLIRGSSSVDPN